MKRVTVFFDRLKLITDHKKIKNYCALECKFIKENYSTFASQRKTFTKYRNYLKNFYFQDLKINNAIADIKLLKKQINSDNPSNQAIIEWAKSQGCEAITLTGRPGWTKSFLQDIGYRCTQVQMYKEI